VRAVSLCIFFLSVSLGIWAMGQTGVFPETGVPGHSPEGVSAEIPNLDPFRAGVSALSGFIVGAVASRLLGADPLRVVGISLFGSFFWGAWSMGNDVLLWAEIPGFVRSVILVVYSIAFFLAIQQLCSGGSVKVYG